MARKAGERTFGLRSKDAFAFQFCLEAQKALEQIALAGAADGFNVKLKLAARFVKRDQRTRFNFLPVFQPPAKQLGPAAPHDAAHLGAFIL